MATEEQIREGFQKLAQKFGPAVSNIAIVKSVDEAKATCVLIDEDEQEYLDVRLRPVLNGKQSFLQVPKVGTYVLAIRIEDDDDWMVIAQDESEKFILQTSNKVSLIISESGISIEAINNPIKIYSGNSSIAITDIGVDITSDKSISLNGGFEALYNKIPGTPIADVSQIGVSQKVKIG